MTQALVEQPNPEYHRKAAKALLKALKQEEPAALERLRQHHRFAEERLRRRPRLSDAQFVLAREHGYPNWPAFMQAVEWARLDFSGRVRAFIVNALPALGAGHRMGDLQRANALLASEPAVAGHSIVTGCVLGDAETVRRELGRKPELVREKLEPYGWEPLLYLCFSRYLRLDPARSAGFMETARLLLAAGADPNACWVDNDDPNARETPLYAAAGIAGHTGLTRLLLDAGADPSDGLDDKAVGPESLYHACEHADTRCLAMVLQAGPRPQHISYCLARALDFENTEAVRLFLEHGADPNFVHRWGEEETRLHKAVRLRRGLEIIRLLVEHGGDPNARDKKGATPYTEAVRTGNRQVAEVMEAHGADTAAPSAADRFIGAVLEGNAEKAGMLRREHAEAARQAVQNAAAVLIQEAAAGHLEGVRRLLDAGVPASARGEHEVTALHWAAFYGRLEVVKLLLERGADVAAVEKMHQGIPFGWAEAGESFGGIEDNREVKALLARNLAPRGVFFAAMVGDLNEVKRQIAADPGQANAFGHHASALDQAAWFGYYEIAEALLEAGANPNLPAHDGATPLDRAIARGHEDVIELLRESGGKTKKELAEKLA